jgi:DUF177 domain-containing protein
MPLLVNLRHLETGDLELRGELPVEELALEVHDEVVRAEEPLRYELTVQSMEKSLLVQGRLQLTLKCECVRCLKAFAHTLELNPWTRHVALEGEEKVAVNSDCVDLTPLVREDILLEFPQHPLCEANCRGLPKTTVGKAGKTSGSKQTSPKSSAWAELDKLKF